MTRILSLILILSTANISGQDLLKNGPMNGYSEMREVMIWAQMNEPCIVELVYWPDSMPGREFYSRPIAADPDNALVVHLLADSVEPGGTYNYAIYANGKNQTEGRELSFSTQHLWQHRSDPPEIKFAIGSCAFVNEPVYDRPGDGYGSNYKIFETIEKAHPDLMLWLGDNIYLREADWYTRTGILERYTHARSLPELQGLLSSTHHYAIWDDHDYGPNDANRAFPHKNYTLEAFKLFWANNGYGVAGNEGITGAFQFGDVAFFLLDNRWNRTDPDLATVDEQMLGKTQVDWLIEILSYSKAPFKFVAVGSQILNDAKMYENFARYEKEREMLLNRIAQEKITGVVFLTGDRHRTELSKVVIDGIEIYDLTISPLTSKTYAPRDEVNSNRVEGTLAVEHNFGLLHLTGPKGKRNLRMESIDSAGNKLWEYSIEEPSK